MKQYVCGRNAVMELLKSGVEVDKLYIQKGELKGSIKAIIAKASDKRIIISEVDKRKLDELSEGLPHQGVVAYVSDYKYYEVDEIIEYARSKNEAIRLIILDEIEDPHNTGSIIRTAETAGFHGVIMPKEDPPGLQPQCTKLLQVQQPI